MTSGDFDADGDPDLAVAQVGDAAQGRTVHVLYNEGKASSFRREIRDVAQGPFSILSADIDGDGDLDLATASCTEPMLSVLLNEGSGAFGEALLFAGGGESLCAADLDADGDPDLATVAGTGREISVMVNAGGRSFEEPLLLTTGALPKAVAAGDVDGDGDTDLVTAHWRKIPNLRASPSFSTRAGSSSPGR